MKTAAPCSFPGVFGIFCRVFFGAPDGFVVRNFASTMPRDSNDFLSYVQGLKTMSKVFRIAAIAGDGIGLEVMPEGVRVVEAAAKKF
ncbi:hypothetical protein, partial [Paraburkholderia sp. J67]|uniref:hypothetical protein n=1 Tax=Paraburkholderia sp. J67 TaxID=2805435 RepID=UPI002ABE8F7A